MKSEVASGIMLTLLLMGMITLAFNIQIAKAEPTTWTVDDDGPADFNTIQEAINAASPGDTIFVKAGTYYETVTVDKAVKLIGENVNITIIDGQGYPFDVVGIESNNTKIDGFTIQNSGSCGIVLSHMSNVTIINNIIADNEWGIKVSGSSNNTISNNKILANVYAGVELSGCSNNTVTENYVSGNHTWGVYLKNSHNNTISGNTVINNFKGIVVNPYAPSSRNNKLRDNTMIGNKYNFEDGFPQWNDVDVSNTVDGKPIYYLVNRHDEQVSLDAGYVALINSTNIVVKDLELSNNDVGITFYLTNFSLIQSIVATNMYSHGIKLVGSPNNTIIGNEMSSNGEGIRLLNAPGNVLTDNRVAQNQFGVILIESDGNTIRGNNIEKNDYGIHLHQASNNAIADNDIADNNSTGINLWFDAHITPNNAIFHNNFVNNPKQVEMSNVPQPNFWDDGYPSGGNYWSDYTSKYPDAQELDGSGLWDTPYVIGNDNQDNYPLMKPHVRAQEGEETAIITKPGHQMIPRIYDSWVVYIDETDSLYAYNLDNHQEKTIAIDSLLGLQWAAIYDDKVVWSDTRSDPDGDIYMYDLETDEERIICSHLGTQEQPAIYSDKVVWQDWRGGMRDIFMYDLSSNKEIQISNDPADERDPVIYGNIIVWFTKIPEQFLGWYLTAYNISSKEKMQLGDPLALPGPLNIHGNRIVYADFSRTGIYEDIFMYDLDANHEVPICIEEGGQIRPRIYGDKIVWGDTRYSNGIDEADVFMYDLTTNKEVRLSSESSTNRGGSPMPDIYMNTIVWSDDRSGDCDIYMYRLSGPSGDLTISVFPTSQSINQGESAAYTVTITSLGGFASEVSLGCSLEPISNDVTIRFDPESFTLPSGGSVQSTLTVETTSNTPVKKFTITITVSAGEKMKSVTATLSVEVILEVPYQNQDGTGWCGPTSLAMVLRYYGVPFHSWDYRDPATNLPLPKYPLIPVVTLARLQWYVVENYDWLDTVVRLYSLEEISEDKVRYDIQSDLRLGAPVILKLHHPTLIYSHFIVVSGYNETGFFVNDPSGVIFGSPYLNLPSVQNFNHAFVSWGNWLELQQYIPTGENPATLTIQGEPQPLGGTIFFYSGSAPQNIRFYLTPTNYAFLDLDNGLTWKKLNRIYSNYGFDCLVYVSNSKKYQQSYTVSFHLVGADGLRYYSHDEDVTVSGYGEAGRYAYLNPVRQKLTKTQSYCVQVDLWDSEGYKVDSFASPYIYCVVSGTLLKLEESQHHLYLHVYDSEDRHVGLNYETNQTELDIPDSYYFDDLNGTKTVILPAITSNYKVVVDAAFAEEETEAYNLTITVMDNGQVTDQKEIQSTIQKGTVEKYKIEVSENGEITATVLPSEAFPLWIVAVVAVVVIGTAIAAIFLWRRQK